MEKNRLLILNLEPLASFPYVKIPKSSSGIYMFPFDAVLRIVLPPHSFCSGVFPAVETNVPFESEHDAAARAFQSDAFTAVPIVCNPADHFLAEIRLTLPGAFACRFSIGNTTKGIPEFRFVVNPRVTVYSKDVKEKVITLDGMCVQTQITKCLGFLDEWEEHVRLSAESGYNMMHFSPVQPLGISQSAYCILDHSDVSHTMFHGLEESFQSPADAEGRMVLLDNQIKRFEYEYGILSMADVLWNHIAVNAPFLRRNPSIAYTLENTRCLRPAFAVDQVLLAFSVAYANYSGVDSPLTSLDRDGFGEDPAEFSVVALAKQIVPLFERTTKDRGKPIHNPPRTAEDVDSALVVIRAAVDWCRVYEYLQLDVAEELARFEKSFLSETDASVEPKHQMRHPLVPPSQPDGLARRRTQLEGAWVEPQPVSIDATDPKQLLSLLMFYLSFNGDRFGATVDFRRVRSMSVCPTRETLSLALIALNHHVKQQVERWLDEFVRNVGGTMRYERLGPTAPRRARAVNGESPVVSLYFSRLRRDHGRGADDRDGEGRTLPGLRGHAFAVLHNGWVFGSGSDGLTGENFPTWQGGRAVLTRRIIPWADNAKLRYGSKPADSPVLWRAMESYTKSMAGVFHGFRIDNAHATPVHVASYFLNAARKVRPHLFVCAELFTGSIEKDREFVSALGVNLLIREAIHASDVNSLAHFLHEFGGGKPIGSFRGLSMMTVSEQQFCPGHEFLAGPLLKRSPEAWLPPSAEAAVEDVAPVSQPQALFFDVTHDNPSQTQMRTTEQTLSAACLLSMCVCAIGSTRGNDELFEEPVKVTDRRTYPKYERAEYPGIIPARKVLGAMHAVLSQGGFDEFFVDVSGSVLTLQRHNPVTQEAIYSVNLPAFKGTSEIANHEVIIPGRIQEVLLSARLTMLEPLEDTSRSDIEERARLLSFGHAFGMSLASGGEEDNDRAIRATGKLFVQLNKEGYEESEESVSPATPGAFSGLPGRLEMSTTTFVQEVRTEEFVTDTGERKTKLHVHLRPGDVIILRTVLWNDAVVAHESLYASMADCSLRVSIEKLSLVDMNAALWKCAAEETEFFASGLYNLPGYGPLKYGGLGGVVSLFVRDVIPHDDLGHALCRNLRDGNWLMDFLVQRFDSYAALKPFVRLAPIAAWLGAQVGLIKRLPRHLIPQHFARVVMHAFKTLLDVAVESHDTGKDVSLLDLPKPRGHLIMPLSRMKSAELLREYQSENHHAHWEGHVTLEDDPLFMFCVVACSQFFGYSPSAPLLSRSALKNVEHLLDEEVKEIEYKVSNLETFECASPTNIALLRSSLGSMREFKKCIFESALCAYAPSIAAGLPHFATGFMRAWGRDTFIALKGLLLVTHHYAESAAVIAGCAACVNHGLLPNLINGGLDARFNCRDAAWWWVRAVSAHCERSPDGYTFLQHRVPRLYPHRECKAEVGIWTIGDAVQEVMQCHTLGISFREKNAGKDLDERMQEEGFNVRISFDMESGFIFGGNQFNCGTWMDKMGESVAAGNFGIPATPRDGCAIEIAGLMFHAVSWLEEVSSSYPKMFGYRGVNLADGSFLTYSDWKQRCLKSFERLFYVPTDPELDDLYEVNRELVRTRGIYKDVSRSSVPWTEYQFRPNVCVAMTVAPQLFDAQHARDCLQRIEDSLVGPLGMRTLDPRDDKYISSYDMADSDDYQRAKGFGYHNGPEWLWLTGFFVMSVLTWDSGDLTSVCCNVRKRLLVHRQEIIERSQMFSLPELTNADGGSCPFSCPAQAWSVGTLLEALGMFHSYRRLHIERFKK